MFTAAISWLCCACLWAFGFRFARQRGPAEQRSLWPASEYHFALSGSVSSWAACCCPEHCASFQPRCCACLTNTSFSLGVLVEGMASASRRLGGVGDVERRDQLHAL